MNEDKSSRYNRLKRQGALLSLAWNVTLLAGLALSGLSVALRSASSSIVDSFVSPAPPALVVMVYVLLLTLANEAGALPVAYVGGFKVEHQYGLATESLRAWLLDQLKSLCLALALGELAAGVLYVIIRADQDRWWLTAGAACALLVVVLAKVAPVLLLPMFYRVKPLDRESLRARLITLADRAGARVVGAYEWGLGDKTKKANAALAGLGATRRILVSDTMLSQYSEDEIEVVLAHEIAHHVHGDVWKGLLFDGVLVMAGFFAASRALGPIGRLLALAGPSDVAGLPVLLLTGGAVSLAARPVGHALSRAHERRADRFALELTRNPAAFVSAMRRLGAQNLAEEHPSKVIQWLFYTHPPIGERIAAAQGFVVDSQ